jgi:hypothetical protein
MHPLGLLLSITFFTILATHMLTDTIKSLKRDAARWATAERGASRSTCWNVARRIRFEAHGPAEPTLSTAVFTKPRPPQKPESSEYPAVLQRRQMTWLARPGISAHCARGASSPALNGLLYALTYLVPPSLSGATLTCDPQVRIPRHDAFKCASPAG